MPASQNAVRRHYRACNLCEAICGLEITLDAQDQIIEVRGDAQDPFSQGHICPKAVALTDIYRDPNRLREPVRRTADGWQTISWDEAFDEVAARIRRVQTAHGRDAFGSYQGNPSVHNSGTLLSGPDFLRALGSRHRFSATSADQLPHHFAAWLMFGHPLLLPIPDLDRTSFMLIIGANPLASNGSLMTAPGVGRRLREVQQRGGRIVVIDPRRTETAQKADVHHFIRPGADVYLLLALLHELAAQDALRPRPDLIDAEDLAALRELVAAYTPAAVAVRTGLEANVIRQLAHDLAAAPNAVVYGRMGVSVQEFGGVCQWLINVLNIVTGNFDRAGGAMFPSPAFDLLARAKPGRNYFNRWRSSVRGLPEFDGELPVATLAEEISAGQVKGLMTVCGNPVLSTPNGAALDKALASLDFMVAVDIYINETTRHADIILPPATGLETAHYDLAFHHLAVRNTAKYSPPLYPRTAAQRYDWEIFAGLTQRLTAPKNDAADGDKLQTAPAAFAGDAARAALTPAQKLDLGLRYGSYHLSLQQLEENPHGLDLGPLQPVMPARLLTADGRVNLLPELLMQDLARVRAALTVAAPSVEEAKEDEKRDLVLIGRRHLRSNNSWMHNAERLMKGRNRCTLLIHPQSAQQLGLAQDGWAEVRSRTGAVVVPVEITENIMPGVVSLPHGYGHNRAGVKLDVAAQHAGASLNDVTDHLLIDQLTGNAAFSGVPVTVSRAYLAPK